MIYQLVNKKTKILPSIATTYIAHFYIQFNQVFAQLVSCLVLKHWFLSKQA